MSSDLILKKHSKSETVAAAIEEQIENGALVPGDRLMTVRELSTQYGFNERTVLAALKILLEEELIEKIGKGYFVASPDQQVEETGTDTPHPFIGLNSFGASTRTIRMAVYENMEHQKNCWEEIAERFGEEYPGMSLELKWVPNFIDGINAYHTFLREEKIDLALLPEFIAMEFLKKKAFVPLPAYLQKRINSPEYLSSYINRGDNELSKYTAPVHFSMQGVLLNHDTFSGELDLAASNFAKLTDKIINGGLSLNKEALFMNFPWELAILSGNPGNPVAQDDLENFFKDLYGNIAKFRCFKDKCRWKMYPAEKLYLNYSKSNIMFYSGSLTMEMPLLRDANFKLSGTFCHVGEDRFLPTGISSIAIMKDAYGPVEAAVDFLTSKSAQSLITKHFMNISCYLETNRPLLKKMNASESDFMTNVKKLTTNENDKNWHSIIVLELKHLTQSLIEEEITVETAVTKAMEYIKDVYPERLNN